MDKITIDREAAEQAANALLDLPLRTDREVIAEALRAALAALAAQPAEPMARRPAWAVVALAALNNGQSIKPGGAIHEAMKAAPPAPAAVSPKTVAWRIKPMISQSRWSLTDDGYYASCKRDQGYIVEPLCVTPPAPTAAPLTEEWAADVLGIPRTELSVSEFSTYQRERIACVLTGARAVLAAGDKP